MVCVACEMGVKCDGRVLALVVLGGLVQPSKKNVSIQERGPRVRGDGRWNVGENGIQGCGMSRPFFCGLYHAFPLLPRLTVFVCWALFYSKNSSFG